MPPRSVLVTYTIHPSPVPSSISPLETALDGIRSQLPLRNLHWKSSSRTAIRTIQEVEVNLVELGEAGSIGKEVAGSVLELPLVNICLVACDSDELYKTQTKSFIRDWLSLLAARRNVHAPLIVLVNPSSATSTGKNVFGRDKGVLGKLKTDFNTAKRDRCVQINLPPTGTSDLAAWVEMINKLKESIITAFDAAILEREEEIKRGEAQRLHVGWNFCTWFLLKESLAQSFTGVNLHEDALITYEELEATFFQILKEQNLSWFGKLGANQPNDDSLPILDVNAKPYREMLKSSTISIFDFRIYVFACQGYLLGRLGRITEIAKRGQWFVASLTRRLREREGDLAEHFIESWTYTACMDIVQKCDEWSRVDRPNGDYSGLIAYESARSELLDIARVQVERIGVACGHLPNTYPFSPPSALLQPTDDVLFESSDAGLSDTPSSPTSSPRPLLSSPAILDAMSNPKNLQNLYQILTKRSITAYEACEKRNSIIRLRADLAGLALYSEDWRLAWDLCRGLARDCAEMGVWDPVANFALGGAIRSHSHLGSDKDDEWVNIALAYLRVCAISDVEAEDLEALQEVLRGLATSGASHTAENHKAFLVKVLSDVAIDDKAADQSSLQVKIVNSLPVPVTVDKANLILEDGEHTRVNFSCGQTDLSPGSNVLTFACTTSVQGLFFVKTAYLDSGKTVFLYPQEQLERRVHIRRNAEGVRVVLRMPYDISLDSDSHVVLEVHTGENAVEDLRLELSTLVGDVRYILDEANHDGTALTYDGTGIGLGDLAARMTMEVNIPYSSASQVEATKARIRLVYRSSGKEGRDLIDTQELSMGLPLTVNVQDFFRPHCLVSNFTIASDGREYMRIGSVKLVPPEDGSYTVEGSRSDWSDLSTVTPHHPLSCIFKIKQGSSLSSKGVEAVLRLVVEYRDVAEEVQTVVEQVIVSHRPSVAVSKRLRKALSNRSTWLGRYLLNSNVREAVATSLLDDQSEGVLDESELNAFLVAIGNVNPAPLRWRTLEIPVEIPQRRILTTVRIDRTSPDALIHEGRALAMNVRMATSLTWAGGSLPENTKLVFDIQGVPDDWIILGKKKGYYTADPTTAQDQQIVLVPMRSGSLFLPTVTVQLFSPIANDGLVCETYVENAAETINVLPAKAVVTALIPVRATAWTEEGH